MTIIQDRYGQIMAQEKSKVMRANENYVSFVLIEEAAQHRL